MQLYAPLFTGEVRIKSDALFVLFAWPLVYSNTSNRGDHGRRGCSQFDSRHILQLLHTTPLLRFTWLQIVVVLSLSLSLFTPDFSILHGIV